MTPDPPIPAARPEWVRRVRRITLRALRAVFVVYIGFALLIAAWQRSLIFPGRRTQGHPDAVVQPQPGTELVRLTTAGGDRIVALFGPALTETGAPHPAAAHQPTLLYCYGNGMCLRDAQEQIDPFRRLGVNVLIPEYVGYGMSSGTAGEAGCFAAAEAAYRHLAGRHDVDPRRVVAAGWSLGGAAAIDVAAREPVAGLATFSTFTSMVDMGRMRFRFLPISLLLRHPFRSEEKMARVRCPYLLVHGAQDLLVPPVMADRLAAAYRGPHLQRVTIPDAGHNDVFAVGGEQILAGLRELLGRLPRGGEN